MFTTRSALTACLSISQLVRVGVLLLGAVELFHALGRLLRSSSACHVRVAGSKFGMDGRRVPRRRSSRAPGS